MTAIKIYTLQPVPVTVTPDTAPTLATCTITQSTSGGGSVAPPSLVFSSTTPQVFVFTASPTAVSNTITFGASGGGLLQSYNPPPPVTFTVLARSTITPSGPASVYAAQAPVTITLTPGAAPDGGVNVTVSCTIGTPNPTLLSFADAVVTPVSYTYTPPATAPYSVNCSYSVSGTDQYHYENPVTTSVAVLVRGNFSFSASATAPLYSLQASSLISVTPSQAPLNGSATLSLSCSGGGGGTASTSLLTFPVGSSAAQSFVYTAGSGTGTVTCSYSLGGGSFWQFVQPAPTQLQVNARATFNATLPTALYAVQSTQSLLFAPSAAPVGGSVALTIDCGGRGSLSPAVLTFPASSLAAQPFVYTAPVTAPLAVVCNFTVGGTDAAHYAPPADRSISILARALFSFTPTLPASLYTLQPSAGIAVVPAEAPSGGSVTITIACDQAAALNTTLLTFAAGSTAAQSFFLTAPNADSITVHCNFTIGGADSAHFEPPAQVDIAILSLSSTGADLSSSVSFSSSTEESSSAAVVASASAAAASSSASSESSSPELPSSTGEAASSSASDESSSAIQASPSSTAVGGSSSAEPTTSSSAAAAVESSSGEASPSPVASSSAVLSSTAAPGSSSVVSPSTSVQSSSAQAVWSSAATSSSSASAAAASSTALSSSAVGSSSAAALLSSTAAVSSSAAASSTGARSSSALPLPSSSAGSLSSTGAASSTASTSFSSAFTSTGLPSSTGLPGSSSLAPLPLRVYAAEGGVHQVITFNATVLVPAFTARITSLPAAGAGSLFQTSDGVTPSTPISSVPTTVSDVRQRVIYLPPSSGVTLYDYTTPLSSFSYTVSNALQGSSSSSAAVQLFVAHVNQAPALGTPSTDAGGEIALNQNAVADLGGRGFGVSDSDAGASLLQLNLTVGSGLLRFDAIAASNGASMSPGLRTIVNPPSGLLPLSRSNFTLLASAADLTAILLFLSYVPSMDFVGVDSLNIGVDDRGNRGVGPAQSASLQVPLRVRPVNQPIKAELITSAVAPAVALGLIATNASSASFQINSTQALPLYLPFVLRDPDAYFESVTVELTALHGNFSLFRPTTVSPALQYTLGSNGAGHLIVRGTLSGLNVALSNLTFTPEARFYGSDMLLLRANDEGHTGLGGATEFLLSLELNLASLNHPPEALSMQYTLKQDRSQLVTLQGVQDMRSSAQLEFLLTSLPSSECATVYAVTAAGGRGLPIQRSALPLLVSDTLHRVLFQLSYAFFASPASSCSFTFLVRDSVSGRNSSLSLQESSRVGVVSFVILKVNHPPTALSQVVNVFANTSRIITLQCNDVDEAVPSCALYPSRMPINGDLYQWADPAGGAQTALGDPISLGLPVTDPLGRIVYAPRPNATASDGRFDVFEFAAVDREGAWSLAPGLVEVLMVAALIPLAPSFVVRGVEDADASVYFVRSQSQTFQIQVASATIRSLPTRGALFVMGADALTRGEQITTVPFTVTADARTDGTPAVIYSPPALEFGDAFDNFTYVLTSTLGVSSEQEGRVSFNLGQTNHPPVATGRAYTNVGSVLDPLQFLVSDPDAGDVLSVYIAALPAHGTLTNMDGTNVTLSTEWALSPLTSPLHQCKYTPDPTYNGGQFFDELSFFTRDAVLRSPTARITFIVGAATLNPVALSGVVFGLEGSDLNIGLNASDPKRGAVTAWITPTPTHGTLYQTNGDALTLGQVRDSSMRVLYRPPMVGFGAAFDSFSFRALDSQGQPGNIATITISLEHVRRPPIVAPLQSVRLLADQIAKVTLEATATEPGAALSATIRSLPANGLLFTCVDQLLLSAAQLRVDAFSAANFGQPITSVPFALNATRCNTLSGNATNSVWFVPPLHSFGPAALDSLFASFAFDVESAGLVSSSATLNLHVVEVLYPPVAVAGNATTLENTPVLLELQGTAIDGAELQGIVDSLPPNATLYQIAFGPMVPGSEPALLLGDPILQGFAVTDVLRRVWFVPAFSFTGRTSFAFRMMHRANNLRQSLTAAAFDIQVDPRAFPPLLPAATVQVSIKQATATIVKLTALDRNAAGGPPMALTITTLPGLGQLYQLAVGAVFNRSLATGSIPSTYFEQGMDPLLDRSGLRSRRRRLLAISGLDQTTLGSAILSVPALVSHPSGSVLFIPDDYTFGNAAVDPQYLYASFSYTATIGSLTPVNPSETQVQLLLLPEYQRPTAYDTRITARENEAIAFSLAQTYLLDPTLRNASVSVSIVSLPVNGSTLCQFAHIPANDISDNDVSVFPCGPAFGRQLVVGSTISDFPQLRFVLLPPPDAFGVLLEAFSFVILDSTSLASRTSSNVATVSVDVDHVPQRPRARNSTRTLTSRVSVLRNIQLLADCADYAGRPEELFYSVLSLPPKGRVYVVPAQRAFDGLADSASLVDLSGLEQLPRNASLYPYSLNHSTWLLFDAANDGSPLGGGDPSYGAIRWRAHHPLYPTTLFSDASVDLDLVCTPDGNPATLTDLVPNVWTSLINPTEELDLGLVSNPLCLTCPRGASCSFAGIYLPYSQAGWWRLPTHSEGQPSYVQCAPPSACVAAQFFVSGGPISATGAAFVSVWNQTMGGPSTFYSNMNGGCAPGYSGFVCSMCDAKHYRLDDSCATCGTEQNLLFLVLVYGLPFCLFLAATVVLLSKLQVDTTFLTIGISFFQTTSSFKKYRLNWPESTNSAFSIMSLLNLNPQLLSVECSVPELVWLYQWIMYMSLPLFVGAILLVACVAVTLVKTLQDCIKKRKSRRAKAQQESMKAAAAAAAGGDAPGVSPKTRLRDLVEAVSEVADEHPSDDHDTAVAATVMRRASMRVLAAEGFLKGIQKPATEGASQVTVMAAQIQSATLQRRLSAHTLATAAELAAASTRSFNWGSFIHRSFTYHLRHTRRTFLAAFIMLLNFLFLPLTIKALEILECAERDDGSRFLVVEPSLSCDESWWRTWSAVGWCCLFFYSVGLLLMYCVIFFKLRPHLRSLPLFQLPPGSLWSFLFELWIPRDTWIMRGRWARNLRVMRLDSVGNANPEAEVAVVRAMGFYARTYRALLRNYHERYFWFALPQVVRLLALSLIAVRMQATPLYQCVCAMIVLSSALILQSRWRPFRSVTEHKQAAKGVRHLKPAADGTTAATEPPPRAAGTVLFRTHSYLNELSSISFVASLLILFLGLVFFLDYEQNVLHTENRTSSLEGQGLVRQSYPVMLEFLRIVWHLTVAVTGFVMCALFLKQLSERYPTLRACLTMQSRRKGRHSRVGQKPVERGGADAKRVAPAFSVEVSSAEESMGSSIESDSGSDSDSSMEHSHSSVAWAAPGEKTQIARRTAAMRRARRASLDPAAARTVHSSPLSPISRQRISVATSAANSHNGFEHHASAIELALSPSHAGTPLTLSPQVEPNPSDPATVEPISAEARQRRRKRASISSTMQSAVGRSGAAASFRHSTGTNLQPNSRVNFAPQFDLRVFGRKFLAPPSALDGIPTRLQAPASPVPIVEPAPPFTVLSAVPSPSLSRAASLRVGPDDPPLQSMSAEDHWRRNRAHRRQITASKALSPIPASPMVPPALSGIVHIQAVRGGAGFVPERVDESPNFLHAPELLPVWPVPPSIPSPSAKSTAASPPLAATSNPLSPALLLRRRFIDDAPSSEDDDDIAAGDPSRNPAGEKPLVVIAPVREPATPEELPLVFANTAASPMLEPEETPAAATHNRLLSLGQVQRDRTALHTPEQRPPQPLLPVVPSVPLRLTPSAPLRLAFKTQTRSPSSNAGATPTEPNSLLSPAPQQSILPNTLGQLISLDLVAIPSDPPRSTSTELPATPMLHPAAAEVARGSSDTGSGLPFKLPAPTPDRTALSAPTSSRSPSPHLDRGSPSKHQQARLLVQRMVTELDEQRRSPLKVSGRTSLGSTPVGSRSPVKSFALEHTRSSSGQLNLQAPSFSNYRPRSLEIRSSSPPAPLMSPSTNSPSPGSTAGFGRRTPSPSPVSSTSPVLPSPSNVSGAPLPHATLDALFPQPSTSPNRSSLQAQSHPGLPPRTLPRPASYVPLSSTISVQPGLALSSGPLSDSSAMWASVPPPSAARPSPVSRARSMAAVIANTAELLEIHRSISPAQQAAASQRSGPDASLALPAGAASRLLVGGGRTSTDISPTVSRASSRRGSFALAGSVVMSASLAPPSPQQPAQPPLFATPPLLLRPAGTRRSTLLSPAPSHTPPTAGVHARATSLTPPDALAAL